MAKRSFFERLTGAVDIEDDFEDVVPEKTLPVSRDDKSGWAARKKSKWGILPSTFIRLRPMW